MRHTGKQRLNMKPKTFIGSSTEAIHIAEAIHAELQKDVECTVWTHGVFKLSHN
jgi:predicted nucleotide-binding protein